MISKLEISAMLDYGKDCLRRIYKEMAVAVMVSIRQGFPALTKAFTTVSDH